MCTTAHSFGGNIGITRAQRWIEHRTTNDRNATFKLSVRNLLIECDEDDTPFQTVERFAQAEEQLWTHYDTENEYAVDSDDVMAFFSILCCLDGAPYLPI